MEATRPADPTRAGAVWVTATGAFLLFAAAVVLVAVRWEQIPDGMKLGALAALSGGLLLAGRRGDTRLARVAPAAADVLFHLGAFLVPVTAAAVFVHLDVPRDVLLLTLGAGSAVLFELLGRTPRSVVLRWAAATAVVVATVGLGGLTPVPATGWLVLLAVGALALGRGTAAGAWAVTATLGPLVALAGDGGLNEATRATVVDAVGRGLTPGVVGVGAAGVLTALAHRRRALPLAALAGVALVSGVAVAWQDLDPSAATQAVALAATFLLLEAAALLLRRDPFWGRPVAGLGVAGEVLAAPALLSAVIAVLISPFPVLDGDGATAVAFALAALAWLVADLRRTEGELEPGLGLLTGGPWWPGTVAASLNVIAAVAVGTASATPTSAAALAVAGLLVLSGRTGSVGLVPTLTGIAVALVADDPATITVVGLGGALLVAYQATLHRVRTAHGLATFTPVPVAVTLLALLGNGVGLLPVVLGGLVLLWAQAAVLDTSPVARRLGDVPRLTALLLVALTAVSESAMADLALVGAAFSVLVTLDAARRSDAALAWGWALGLPVTIGAGSLALGLDGAAPAIPLSVAAVPFALVTLRLGRLRPAVSGTALALATTGLAFATFDPGVMGTVLILDGIAVLAAGLAIGQPAPAMVGGLAAVAGCWQHLQVRDIEALDLYALPVAVLLWIVGSRLADAAVSSWVTHGPAVALAGATALAERIDGGHGAHAVLAGAVALVAVVEGGGRRLAAPLLLGTGLLVALTVHETTAVTAGVPTWAWLAAGGSLLVGAGLAMERHQLGPVETGRRLVDVVQDNFR